VAPLTLPFYPMVGFGPAATIAATREDGRRGVRTGALSECGTHRVDGHLLVLVTASRGWVAVDFVRYPCRPGTLLWIRPGQAVQCGPRLEAVAIGWDDGFLPDLPIAPWTVDDPFGPVCWQLAGEDEDAVIDGVSQLVVDCERFGHGDAATAMLRHQLAVLVLRVAMVPPVPALPDSTVEAEAYLRFRREVEEGYADSRRVEQYAEKLGCSVRTLTRACLAAAGRSAKQVLDDRVALEAKRLLACTDLPVAAVGGQLGFPEPTHFGRFFHREVGCTPGAFRAAASGSKAHVPWQRV
jgi:AraC-like DNA-binding protein